MISLFHSIPFLNDDFDIDYYALEDAFKNIKIFILCNPNNPNGKIFSFFELDKIIDLANKYKVTIISDEIHSDIVSPNKRSHSLLELDKNKLNNCYILYSPSKAFNLAGLHSSVVISLNKERLASIQAQLYKDNVGEPSYFAIEPVIAAMVSLSPPMEMALRIASSKLVDSKNASNACGTDF